MILSGLQSDDNGNAQLGLILAELLNMSHASLVMGTEIENENWEDAYEIMAEYLAK